MPENLHHLSEAQTPGSNAPPLVLVAEDDPLFRHLIQNQLQSWGYASALAYDGNQAWDMIQDPTTRADLIILDWLMPGIKGIELCRRIRQMGGPAYQYILLVSSKDEKKDIIEGLDSGADDYLTKPFDFGELRARLRTGTRIVSLQKELLRAQEELGFRASHDALTGLWNRSTALELLTNELQRANRNQGSTGVLMIDVDHFKRVNDTYGHLTGDQILKEVAARISRAVRAYDHVGRYGGEEFISVISNCSAESLRTIAERTLTSVGGTLCATSSANLHVSVSIGAVQSRVGMSEMEVLAAADSALYQAKRNGRNQIVIGSYTTPQPGGPRDKGLIRAEPIGTGQSSNSEHAS